MNSTTLETLIRELTDLKEVLSPKTEVRISMPLSDYGGHTYDIYEFRFSQLPPEPEHTCHEDCTCRTDEHGNTIQDGIACPFCDCEGCTEDVDDRVMYIVMGNQDPYSMPSETDGVEDL